MRLLIADDHAFYREGVRTMLSSVPETEVIGEADTEDEVIALALTLQPDVILMDLNRRSVISFTPLRDAVTGHLQGCAILVGNRSHVR